MMIRYRLGMIAALPEFGPGWLFRLCDRPATWLHHLSNLIGDRFGDFTDFDDGYDRIANRAARWKMRGDA